MEWLKEAVLRHARNQPEGVPLTAKGLLHLGSRAAVDQTLSRLARSGDLLRAGRGLYVLPIEGRFGNRAPALEKTAEALATQLGERITNSGAMAANVLGLTTQVPVTPVFLTRGRAGHCSSAARKSDCVTPRRGNSYCVVARRARRSGRSPGWGRKGSARRLRSSGTR